MARTRTRLQLRTEIRELTDTVNSTHTTDATLNDWIDQDLALLWDMLVSSDPDRYRAEIDIPTTAGTRNYGVGAGGFPTDFHSQIALDFVRNPGAGNEEIYPINEYKFSQRTFGPDDFVDAYGIPSVRYEVFGQGVAGTDVTLRFDRDPGTETYRLYYVQAPQPLIDDTAVFDGVAGWEEWAVRSTCIRVAGKEETDPSVHAMERDKLERRIRVAAGKRDQHQPGMITDVTSRRVDYYSRRN